MKVTEKNMYAVMGKINKFLSKPTKECIGLKQHKVGEKEVTIMGDVIKIPIWEEKITYNPFIGKCSEHYLRKEVSRKIKEKEQLFSDDMYTYHRVLLSINDDYMTSCIPIMAGFDVSITGEKMVIKENDVVFEMASINGTKKRIKNKDKSTYCYFYHMPITEEEYQEKIRSGLFSLYDLVDQKYYYTDLYNSNYPEYIKSSLTSIHQDLCHGIGNILESLDLKESEVVVDLKYDTCSASTQKDVKLHVNIDRVRKGISVIDKNPYPLYLTVNDEIYDDVFNAVEDGILDEEISDYFDEEVREYFESIVNMDPDDPECYEYHDY